MPFEAARPQHGVPVDAAGDRTDGQRDFGYAMAASSLRQRSRTTSQRYSAAT
jgi:hypothetical protein